MFYHFTFASSFFLLLLQYSILINDIILIVSLCNFSVVPQWLRIYTFIFHSAFINYVLCVNSVAWWLTLVVNLTHLESPEKRLSMRCCLYWVGLWAVLCNWCAKTQPLVDSIIPQSGMITSMSLAINLSHKKVSMSVLSFSALDCGCDVTCFFRLLPRWPLCSAGLYPGIIS